MIPSLLMRRFAMLMSFLVACGGSGDDTSTGATNDAKKPAGDGVDPTGDGPDPTGDGPNPNDNTSCANPIATSSEAQVNLSGTTSDGSLTNQGSSLGGVTVGVYHLGSSTPDATTTSEDPSAIYQIMQNTHAVIDYVQGDKSGFVGTRFFPQAPIHLSQSLRKLPLFTSSELATITSNAGGTGIPTLVIVSDCSGSLKSNATVTAPAGATVKYLHSDNTTNGTSTDSTGAALVFGLSGTATIGAMVGGTAYHSHQIVVDSSHFAFVFVSER